MSDAPRSTLVAVRNALPDDINFIYASWLRGLYYGESWFSLIPKDAFMAHYHEIIRLLLLRPDTTVRVACLKDDPDVILGYAVLKGDDTLHWVFVKAAWRGIGIAKSLLPHKITAVTHLTKVGHKLLNSHPGIVFNPFL